MENEKIIPFDSILNEKRELSKSSYNKNKISNFYQNYNSNINSNNNKMLSPVDVNTPPENNSFSYLPQKNYTYNTNNNESAVIRKRKPLTNQDKIKKQKVDVLHQNWQRIQKYIKKHSESEDDIENLKKFFDSFSSKTVPEQYKEDQLLLDVWFEFIHTLMYILILNINYINTNIF